MGDYQLNVANGIREFARISPNAAAVIDGPRSLTFGEVDERASRLANYLRSCGLQPADRVAFLAPNCLEWIEVPAGIAKAGLVMVPLNPRSAPPEHTFILGHSDARALIVDATLVASVGADYQTMTSVLTMHGDGPGTPYEAAIAQVDAQDPEADGGELSPFCIAYTSGTTGRPKGVILSHRARALMSYAVALEWRLGPGRRTAAIAPMYHGAGFAFGYAGAQTGATVSMLGKWDPVGFLEMVQRDRLQSVFLVPTHAQQIRALSDHPGANYDLSSLDTLYFNAAALPVSLKRWVFEAFPGVDVHELYGSTEAGVVTNLRPQDAHTRAGSVGHPWYMTEVRVVDDAGSVTPAGTPGELFSRSPFVMSGYLHDETATGEVTTADGFVTSGDIAVVDDDGFISIVDRKKDLIITGGLNVYPREIEEALLHLDDVADAAVVGTADEQWGERVVAFVVGRGGVAPDVETLPERLGHSLARYKVPRDWHVVEVLPRNGAGKVVKGDLRNQLTP